MDLRQLEYFVAVAEQGSFSRAAARLNLSQPSLSRQVALLERELSQRLLQRTGRGVAVTEAGQTLLGHARPMLAAAEQARFELKEMRDEPRGSVVVGLPHRVATGLCVPLVREFRRRLPHAMVSVSEGLSLSLREDLIAGRVDVALLFDPAPTPLLRSEQLMRERLVLMAPSGRRLPPQVSLHALQDEPMVLPSSPNPIRTLVDAVLLPRKLRLNLVAEVGAVHSAMSVVEAGLACSILPESALLQGSQPPRVVWAPIGPPAMWNMLVVALPAARPLNRLTLETARMLRALDFREPDRTSF